MLTEYLFSISNKQVSDMYSLVSRINHDGNSMSTGNLYSYTIDFNTCVWWRCDVENMTQIKAMSSSC